jgi:acetyltransferase-like isoleucine patch superfamily enzyme
VSTLQYVLTPREIAGDDDVRLVEWLVPEGSAVDRGTVIAVVDTSKAAYEIETEFSGFLFHLVQRGSSVTIGDPLAVVTSENVRPAPSPAQPDSSLASSEQTFTRKALALLEQHQIPRSAFSGRSVVRHTDVEEYIASRRTRAESVSRRFFGAEELNPADDWEGILDAEELSSLQALLTNLRRRLKAKFNRHVPLGTLLHDRWAVAAEYGFGEGTSVYDECLILGDVRIGEHCWVGPFTVLDGNFASVRIGDYTSIGAGAHIYSHHTIDRTITKGKAPVHAADTVIGEACFIAPKAIVGPGSRIGDHSFVASGSYVQGVFPEYSFIAGNPAKKVGRVEIRHDRVLLLKDE